MAKSSVAGDLMVGAAAGLATVLILPKFVNAQCQVTTPPAYCSAMNPLWIAPIAGFLVGGIAGAIAAGAAEVAYSLYSLKNIG